MNIDAGTAQAVLAAITLLVLLWRVMDGFASKKEVKAAHEALQKTISDHRSEAKELVGGAVREITSKNDDVIHEVREMGSRVGNLEDWSIRHEAEDKAAHGVIEEVRDYMQRPVPITVMAGSRGPRGPRGTRRHSRAVRRK